MALAREPSEQTEGLMHSLDRAVRSADVILRNEFPDGEQVGPGLGGELVAPRHLVTLSASHLLALRSLSS